MTVDTDLRPLPSDAPTHSTRRRVAAAVAAAGVCLAAFGAVAWWRAMDTHPSAYGSPQEMASKLGCSQSFQPSEWATDASTPTIGTCTRNGIVLTLATFPSAEAVNAWWIAARQFSPHSENLTPTIYGVTGENWAVTSPDAFSDTVVQILQAP
jgi:hypothetical protein